MAEYKTSLKIHHKVLGGQLERAEDKRDLLKEQLKQIEEEIADLNTAIKTTENLMDESDKDTFHWAVYGRPDYGN